MFSRFRFKRRRSAAVLDQLETGLVSAWSIGRRLRLLYNGPIIRVRRSSDNTEQNFYAGSNNTVSAASIEAFCGAGDGFLVTIYDQSGYSRNFVQSTTTLQPKVVSNGVAITQNSKLSAQFDGSTSLRRMFVGSSNSVYKFLHDGTNSTIYSVQNVTDDASGIKTLITNWTTSGESGTRVSFNSSEGVAVFIRGTNPVIAVNSSRSESFSANVLTLLIDADNATAGIRDKAWKDGVLLSDNNAVTGAVSDSNAGRDLFLGTNSAGSNPFNGNFCELVIWSQDKVANRSTWESSVKTFWGTP